MLLTHVIERAREGLSSCMAISRDPNDAIMTGPLCSWLCFPMQMGFSSDVARWSQGAPGPHSTTFETGRKSFAFIVVPLLGLSLVAPTWVMSPGWKLLVTGVPHRGVGVHGLFYSNHLD